MRRRAPFSVSGLLLVLILLVGFTGPRARAAVQHTVTNLNDSGPGSLRETIATADSGDSIDFATGLTGSIQVRAGELAIGKDLTITGPGARVLTLNAQFASRVLHVLPGATVRLSGMTVFEGAVVGADVAFAGEPGGSVRGGGVLNEGLLTLVDCGFYSNFAIGGRGGPGGSGGFVDGAAIYNSGALTLYGCTLKDNFGRGGAGGPGNTDRRGGGGGRAEGGAIFNDGPALTLINCTIVSNTAAGGTGGAGTSRGGGHAGFALGGGICTTHEGTETLVNCTIAGNRALGGTGGNSSGPSNGGLATGGLGGVALGGGLIAGESKPPGRLLLTNTLIGLNTAVPGVAGTGPDGSGRPGSALGPDVRNFESISQGHNLIGNTADSTGWTTTDRTDVQPALQLDSSGAPALRDNGGQTDTVALLSASPARDGGDDTVLGPPLNLITDQREFPRRIGTAVDIGAFEFDLPQAGPTLIVNTLDDHDDGTASQGDCTLREAIRVANAAPSRQTITFRPGLAGTLTLRLVDLVVTNNVTITGPGARVLTLSGGSFRRVLRIDSGVVSISGLTLRSGRVASTAPAPARGGGLFNAGTLTLTDCAIHDNSAVGGGGTSAGAQGGAGEGGGIYNQGTLSLAGCTFSGNRAVGGRGGGDSRAAGGSVSRAAGGQGGAGSGGALCSTGSLSAVNCTWSDNSATGGRGGTGSPSGLAGAGRGGALFSSGTLAMRNITVAGNRALRADTFSGAADGGGLYLTAAGLLSNTLIAGNTAGTGPDVSGAVRSQGHNLVGNPAGSSGWLATDRTGTAEQPLDPRLGALANNGGPTDTHALLSTSPALNRGNDAAAPPFDQRGFTRAGISDIGAFEFGGRPRATPVNVGVTPSSGASGALSPRLFTTKYSDGDGVGDLAAAYLLINTTATGSNALYGWYDAVNDKLFLRNNANSAWLGGFEPGSPNTISDPAGKGSLNCAGTTVTRSGNLLTVAWSFTPNTSFTGAKNLYLFSQDRAGLSDGFDALGTWTVTTGPSNLGVSPASGSSAAGTQRTLTCTYFDPNGSGNIVDARLLVNSSVSGAGALYAYYDAVNNKVFLRNNANTAWLGGFAPGTPNPIRDPSGQGTLHCGATKVTRSGNTLTITWTFTPAATFTGAKNLYLFVKDAGGLSDGLEPLGTWTVQ